MKTIDTNPKTLAKISKGTRRKKREVNDLEIAEEIKTLYERCDSLEEVARLLRISSEMVRQIKSLTTLEEDVKGLYRDGKLKGYDIGYRISKLQKKDQIILAKQVLNRNLTSEDVRAIVKYKMDNHRMGVSRVIDKVIESKDKNIYVAYLGIEKDTFEKLLRKNKNIRRIVRSILTRVVPYKFVTYFELNGRVVTLKVTKEGLQEIRSAAKGMKVPLSQLVDTLVKRYLEGDK